MAGLTLTGTGLSILPYLNAQPIGAVSTDGFVLQNPMPAAAGAQQFSPRLHWIGQGWETNTSASQTVDWIAELQPAQGSANPSANLVFSSQINGGGYTPTVTFSVTGTFQSFISLVPPFGGYTGIVNDGSNLSLLSGGLAGYFLTAAANSAVMGLYTGSDLIFGFSPNPANSGAKISADSALGRNSAGAIEINQGKLVANGGSFGSLKCASVLTNTPNIGTVSTNGLVLQNTQPAAAGAQQFSPRLHWTGQGWETNTSASQTVDWIAELQPVQGTASPSANLVFSTQINGGGYNALATFDSGGNLTFQSSGGQLNNVSKLNSPGSNTLTTNCAIDAGGFLQTVTDFFCGSGNFLMRSTTAWSNNAGANTATLTNAPVAGNPTKWIKIDDNGTTRSIPAW